MAAVKRHGTQNFREKNCEKRLKSVYFCGKYVYNNIKREGAAKAAENRKSGARVKNIIRGCKGFDCR